MAMVFSRSHMLSTHRFISARVGNCGLSVEAGTGLASRIITSIGGEICPESVRVPLMAVI